MKKCEGIAVNLDDIDDCTIINATISGAGTAGPAGPPGPTGPPGRGIPGRPGQDGLDGLDGEDGSKWYNGPVPPNPVIGLPGDFYLGDDGSIWILDPDLGWIEQPLNITGPEGPVGPEGPIGPQGPPGDGTGGVLPPGGDPDQVLTKLTAADGDADWQSIDGRYF